MDQVLIKYRDNYADEFDIAGHAIVSLQEWQDIKAKIEIRTYPIESYFGTNEYVEYSSSMEVFNSLTSILISEEDANTIINYIGKHSGHIPYGIWDDVELPEKEINLATYKAEVTAKNCGLCPLHLNSPVVFSRGSDISPIMIIGQNPGTDEIRELQPFVGRAGKLLNQLLLESGLDKYDPYFTNVGLCGTPGNRALTQAELEKCDIHLKTQIEVIKPQIIISVGMSSMNWLCPQTQNMKGGALINKEFMSRFRIPTYYIWHTSYLLRNNQTTIASKNYLENHNILSTINRIMEYKNATLNTI